MPSGSGVIAEEIRAFLDRAPVGVVATRRADGSVRQSVVYAILDGDRLVMSTVDGRAKARDVDRDAWASYCAIEPEKPFASVTLEGPARIVREGVGELTTRLFAVITGEPPAQPITDEQLRGMGRVLLVIDVTRTYGASYVSPS